MRIGVIGFDGEGFVKACHGLIQPVQNLENSAKVAVRLDVIRIDGEGPRYEINGNVVFPHLMGDHAEQMQSDRMIAVGMQYLLIESLSLRYATRRAVLPPWL